MQIDGYAHYQTGPKSADAGILRLGYAVGLNGRGRPSYRRLDRLVTTRSLGADPLRPAPGRHLKGVCDEHDVGVRGFGAHGIQRLFTAERGGGLMAG